MRQVGWECYVMAAARLDSKNHWLCTAATFPKIHTRRLICRVRLHRAPAYYWLPVPGDRPDIFTVSPVNGK